MRPDVPTALAAFLIFAVLFSYVAAAQGGPPPSGGPSNNPCPLKNCTSPPNGIGGQPGSGPGGQGPGNSVGNGTGGGPMQGGGAWNGTCTAPPNVSSWLIKYKPRLFDGAHYGVMSGFGYYTNQTVWNMIYNSGMAAFYANKTAFSAYARQYNASLDLIGNISDNLGLSYIRGAGSVDWYFVEPSQGAFNYTLSDEYVLSAEDHGLQPVITIAPFAPWDAVNSQNKIAISSSGPLDFLIFGKYLAAPHNVTAYEQFVANIAKRYGGGPGSVPGLKYPVKYYEVWNEPTGSFSMTNSSASPFTQNYSAFGALVNETRAALVSVYGSGGFYLLPGGAIEAAGGGVINTGASRRTAFYNAFYSGVGSGELSALNWHYNGDKTGASNWTYLASTLAFQTSYQSEYPNLPKPMWLTEFGTYSGSPHFGMGNLTYQSQAQQAAWFVERSAYLFSKGVTVISGLDAQGGVNDPVGSAGYAGIGGRLASPSSCSYRVQAFTQKLLDILIDNFTSAVQLSTDQYAFTVPQGTVYIMWSTGSNSTRPAPQVSGRLSVFDIYGNEATENASQITLGSSPIMAATYNVSTAQQQSSSPSTSTVSSTAPTTTVQAGASTSAATTSIAQQPPSGQSGGGSPGIISSIINAILKFLSSL